ncbi:orotidine-5'-phosphate decarboxylase [Desulfurispirillum indicum]|uniref:Orotidine 5'-phosphate decarboxylase n=1 Tax=Desulfurispirillum indicum (strain ATCC BAA-1389 / DSM 22839 / S5) TaxID=653733 RepID=E6W2B6_DESIS|nr:orotidine-5'-phosphate decarboxylase [Desulfurispirillum indicum]ADU65574.1 orotidine 5'-phosphate decarboxylase [Desulfurispirillum indicum S5]UCZ57594.1 orotidine-5'-phosphate decarboxylase [Desulfurispirillum indicum]
MHSTIIVALDTRDRLAAKSIVTELSPHNPWFKVGKALFVSRGTDIVEELMNNGANIFLDLKFHDIPNTVAEAVKAAADMGVRMVNVHCLGGRRMMEEAANAVAHLSSPPLIIGVTVLTSMNQRDIEEVGITEPIDQEVLKLSALAKDCGLDGVVCSPQEIALIKQQLGAEFITVTPGIRPAWSATDDQTRITTPAEAATLGTDYMVIGRPIIKHQRPLEAYESIQQEIQAALS